MNAAVAIADQGYEVVLIEKEERLGGMANRLHATIEGWDVPHFLQELSQRVQSNPRIQVLTRALVVGFSGFKGNFTTEVLVGPAMYERKIDHGVVILATGSQNALADAATYVFPDAETDEPNAALFSATDVTIAIATPAMFRAYSTAVAPRSPRREAWRGRPGRAAARPCGSCR